ncbi:hypothetical protein GCM10022244_02970 [Streptomyces gulbargensis]|uniref:Uncharacterized protein n=1 Tax=Streptomyces gulbargensis TaxID=364901 RepID=A0ABP7LCC5_9ACTN
MTTADGPGARGGAPVRQVEALAAGAGLGPGGGLVVRRPGDTAAVTRHVDAPARPAVTAHATDPDRRAPAGSPGIRTAPDAARLRVLRETGPTAATGPDGFLLAAHATGAPGPRAADETAPGRVP